MTSSTKAESLGLHIDRWLWHAPRHCRLKFVASRFLDSEACGALQPTAESTLKSSHHLVFWWFRWKENGLKVKVCGSAIGLRPLLQRSCNDFITNLKEQLRAMSRFGWTMRISQMLPYSSGKKCETPAFSMEPMEEEQQKGTTVLIRIPTKKGQTKKWNKKRSSKLPGQRTAQLFSSSTSPEMSSRDAYILCAATAGGLQLQGQLLSPHKPHNDSNRSLDWWQKIFCGFLMQLLVFPGLAVHQSGFHCDSQYYRLWQLSALCVFCQKTEVGDKAIGANWSSLMPCVHVLEMVFLLESLRVEETLRLKGRTLRIGTGKFAAQFATTLTIATAGLYSFQVDFRDGFRLILGTPVHWSPVHVRNFLQESDRYQSGWPSQVSVLDTFVRSLFEIPKKWTARIPNSIKFIRISIYFFQCFGFSFGFLLCP